MSSHLQLGNSALRQGKAEVAIRHYVQALEQSPFLSSSLGLNLALARRHWLNHRSPDRRPQVVLAAPPTSAASARVRTLEAAYRAFADVRIETRAAGDRFLDTAIAGVAAQPCDLLHVVVCDGTAAALAWMASTLWDARVVLDFITPPGAAPATPPTALEDGEWRGWLGAHADRFDAVTVAYRAAQEVVGGALWLPAVDESAFDRAHTGRLRESARTKLQLDADHRLVVVENSPNGDAAVAEVLASVQKLKHQGVRLAWVGALTPAAEQQIADQTNGILVQRLENRDDDALRTLVAAADIVVCIDDSQDQWPAVLPLALAMGRPALVRLLPGLLSPVLEKRTIKAAPGKLRLRLRELLDAPIAFADGEMMRPHLGAEAQQAQALALWQQWRDRTDSPLPEELLPMVAQWAAASAAPLTRALTRTSFRDLPRLPGLLERTPTPTPALPVEGKDASLRSPPPAPTPLPMPTGQPTAAPVSVPEAAVATPAPEWTASRKLVPVTLLGRTIALVPRAPDDTLPEGALAAIQTFARLHALPPGPVLAVDGADVRDRMDALRPWRPSFVAGGLRIVDIGHTTETTVRLRVERAVPEGAASTQAVLTFFQQSDGAGLAPLTSVRLGGPGMLFVDLPLLRALHPWLAVVTDGDGELLGVITVPFPSLCRGGLHHAELALLGSGSGAIENLLAASQALVAEFLDTEATGLPLSLGRIDVDLEEAIGSERLLGEPVRRWLAHILAIPAPEPIPALEGSAPSQARQFLEDTLSSPLRPPLGDVTLVRVAQREASAGYYLELPADALPSLSVLVSRRQLLAAGETASAGAFAVADPVTGRARTLVSMPPVGSHVLALQPARRYLPFPVVRVRSGAHRADGPAGLTGTPLAIRLMTEPPSSTPTLLMPTAPDAAGPLLRQRLAQQQLQELAIAVVVQADEAGDGLAALIESLARQTLQHLTELLLALPDGAPEPAPAIHQRIQDLWPGRHAIWRSTRGAPHVRLNEAASRARPATTHVLVVDASVVLHDPRTLETLATMASAPGVATASCMLLREVAYKKGVEIRFHSGGVFPSQLSFVGRTTLLLDEPVTRHAFPSATYPVVANPQQLMLVRGDTWRQLGGVQGSGAAGCRADVDFGMRVLAAGQLNLCTSALSAFVARPSAGGELADPPALGGLPLERWMQLLGACSVVREVVA